MCIFGLNSPHQRCFATRSVSDLGFCSSESFRFCSRTSLDDYAWFSLLLKLLWFLKKDNRKLRISSNFLLWINPTTTVNSGSCLLVAPAGGKRVRSSRPAWATGGPTSKEQTNKLGRVALPLIPARWSRSRGISVSLKPAWFYMVSSRTVRAT